MIYYNSNIISIDEQVAELNIKHSNNNERRSKANYIFYEIKDNINNIQSQIGTYALHLEPAYKNMKKIGNLENSTKLFHNALTLPLHKNLTQEDQEKICKIVNNTLNN